MKRRSRDEQQELADQQKLLRKWHAFHAEELDDALAGRHGSIIAALMDTLKRLELNSAAAAALLANIESTDWTTVDYNTRLIALHEVNQAIIRLRERSNLPPLSDPLPGQSDSVFLRVQQMLFAPSPQR